MMNKGALVRMKYIGYACDGELGIILRQDQTSPRALVYFYNYPCWVSCYYMQLDLINNVDSERARDSYHGNKHIYPGLYR